MSLNLEENYRHRKLALVTLSKALDDICPKFDEEPEEIRKTLYKERVTLFDKQEKELDKEWEQLDKEALYEVRKFNTSRSVLFKKIEKTDKTNRIKKKVNELEKKLKSRIVYLENKEKEFQKKIRTELKKVEVGSKEEAQLLKKTVSFSKTIETKIQKSIERYNKIINNFRISNNSERVKVRLEHSKEVWDRKYEKLKSKFMEKELIHENKRFELDQIRLAVQGFEEELPKIKHLCTMAGVPLLECYKEAIARLNLLGRKSEKMENIIQEIREKGEENLL
jgi:hypothetical protein